MSECRRLQVDHPKPNVQRPLEVDLYGDDPQGLSSASARSTVAYRTIGRAIRPKFVSALKRCSISADQSVSFRCWGTVQEQAQPGDVPDV